jgi:acyl transferase domain-containing protein/acyl carrier protein
MAQSIAGLKSQPPLIPVYSTVTGAQATAEDFGAEYWGCNIRQTVRFATAVTAMLDAGTDIFVELSPHPVLSAMIAQCGEAASKSAQQLPSLRRGVSEPLQLLRSLAALFAAGREVDWTSVFPKGGRVLQLPTYPWQRKRYWFEVSPASPRLDPSTKLGVSTTNPQTPIHGRRLHSPGIRGFVFEARFDATTASFLQDHRVFGAVIVPAPMIIEMALSAASEAFSAESSAVTDLALRKPLVLSEDHQPLVQLVLDPAIDSIAEFKVHSAVIIEGMEPVWTLHATGRLDLGRQRANRQDRLEFNSLWSRCDQSFSGDDAYRLFERRGVHFGPVFRALQQMALGRDEAVASLCLSEQLTRDLPNYRVHPVLLDAALQAIALSHIKRSATDDNEEVLWLFCGLDRLNVAGTESSRLTCRVVTEPSEDLASGLIRGSAQLYDENGLLVAEVRGAQFRRVTRDSFSTPDQRNQQDLLFEVAWQPWSCPAHALKREAPDYLPAIGQLEARLRTDLAKRCEELAPKPEREVAPALHHLSAEYLTRALRELGWKAVIGDCFAADELMQRLGIVSRHSRLVNRMLEMLCEEGVLQRAGDFWKVVCSLPVSVANTSIHDLRNRFPEYHAELDLFSRCANGLPEVLRGTCDPLQLLFPEGSLESAAHVYQDSPMSRAANGLVRELLQAAVEALPPGRVLRVLEIGAGTGGTSAHLLPLLKGVPCEYVFSDVSKLFLQSARQKFTEFPFVRFSLFDVEQPLESQGFAAQQFDMVVAANVLHATQDIRRSLARARSLLAPGGLLALVEGTQPTRWIDLVFGQTEGWWRFADTDLRPSHPLLSGEQWQQILMDSGFLEASAIPAQSENRSSIFDQAVVLAKAPTAPTSVVKKVEAGVTSLDSPAQPERGAWLIFGDESPLCKAVVSALTNRGIEVLRVDRASEFAILNQRHYRVDPSQTDQVRDAITATLASAKLPCCRAICLWGALPDPSEAERVYRQAIALCEQALNAVRNLAASVSAPQRSFWLVTCGAQPPWTSDLPALAAASVWGLGRVLAVEHPEIWGGIVDLDPAASPQEHVEVIIAQAETPMGEDQCSFRGGVRFVPRLMPRAKLSDTGTHADWSAPGCYLITGGLGGMGLQIAQWMASQGARKIILIGRTALPPRSSWQALEPGSLAFARVAAIREVEAFGAVVRTVAMDVASVREIQRLLKSLEEEEWLPVLGVVHTAAVADDKLVANVDIESLDRVFQPKALGALALEYCLAEQPLRFFICCSSIGALLGHAGQASYAAANAFLDAFVQHRRATKRPALGINWGGWYGAGLALTAGGNRTIKSLEQRGILGFKPAEGLLALNALLQCNCDQAVVIRLDWFRFRQTYPLGEEPPFLSALAARAALPVLAKSLEPATPPPKAELREQLLALDSGEARRGMLESHLSILLAAVLNLDPCAVDVEKSMGALGLDSLMGFELKNRCEQSFGLRLSATMVWNYPTIRALAGHLADKLGVTFSDAPPTADRSKNPSESVSERRFSNVLTSVEQLSEEDAVNALIGGSRN